MIFTKNLNGVDTLKLSLILHGSKQPLARSLDALLPNHEKRLHWNGNNISWRRQCGQMKPHQIFHPRSSTLIRCFCFFNVMLSWSCHSTVQGQEGVNVLSRSLLGRGQNHLHLSKYSATEPIQENYEGFMKACIKKIINTHINNTI